MSHDVSGLWPDLATYRRLAAEYPLVPLVLARPADLETPASLFLKLAGPEPGFLLEEVKEGRPGRYSYVGTAPLEQLLVAEGEDALAALRRLGTALRGPNSERLAPGQSVPPLLAGLFGYFSYDAVRTLEHLPSPPPSDRDLPVAWLMAPGLLAVLDHFRGTVYLSASVLRGAGEDPDDSYARATAVLDRAVERLEAASDGVAVAGVRSPAAPASALRPAGAGGALPGGPLLAESGTFSRDGFLAAVRGAKELIHAGDIFQVVLSQRWQAPAPADPFDIYRHLRRDNPSPYMFYFNFGPLQLVGASPETLVQVSGSHVTVRPIAGTRPRGRTRDDDLVLERELLTDPKERAEHAMLVDLARNDVGRVSHYGSVQVLNPMQVERYSHVMHLVSEVEGELKPGLDSLEALAACFPAGTLTGAPKVRAMEIIDQFEPVRRGPYGGAVGFLSATGDLDMCIAIRTAVVHDGVVYAQAGAGIVADSDPGREYEECRRKSEAVLLAVGAAAEAAVKGGVAEPSSRRSSTAVLDGAKGVGACC